MRNNISVTLIFGAYYSHKHIYRICRKLNRKFKIIIVENSLDQNLKKKIENRYKNAKVIIPKKNIGLAASYNIGIKNSKTKYVYLNCPDIDISNKSLNELINCAEKLKNFGILAPNYLNSSKFNNYLGEKKNLIKKNKIFSTYKLGEVKLIDNSFFLKTSKAKKYLFDEKFFLYFEVTDFCFRMSKFNEKLYISDKIRFKHYGSQSVDVKFSLISRLTKAWHYNWGKFYFYKKHYGYFYALRKIKSNLISAIKKLIINFLSLRIKECYIDLIEFYGIICAILNLKSFYRPKM